MAHRFDFVSFETVVQKVLLSSFVSVVNLIFLCLSLCVFFFDTNRFQVVSSVYAQPTMKREFFFGFFCYMLWKPVVLALEIVHDPAENFIEHKIVIPPGRFERPHDFRSQH